MSAAANSEGGTRMTSTTAPPEPVLLSSNDLARMLSVSVRHVWQLRDAGELPAPIRLGKLIRWRKAAIERWLAESETSRR